MPSAPAFRLRRAPFGLLLVLVLLGAGSLGPVAARGQAASEDPPGDAALAPLRGSSSVSMSIGLLSNVGITGAEDDASVTAAGFLGSVSYAYWPTATVGLEVAAALHDADVSAGSTSSVISVLLGANYFPTALAVGGTVRPYAGASVGPYIGTVSSNNPFSEEATGTQTVFGGRLTAGVDAFPGRWIRLGVRTAYHLMPDFDPALGAVENARGPQFSFTLGVRFGGTR